MTTSTPSEKKAKDKDVSPLVLTAEPGSASNHFNIDVQFPVYSIDWLSNDIILLAGGGGSSRTGVRNRLSLYKIDLIKKEFNLVFELALAKDEDAPMTVVVDLISKTIATGINSSSSKLKDGINNNLRIYTFTQDSITPINSIQTIQSTSEDHYQRVTAFSRSPSTSTTSTTPLIGIGSTNSQFSLVTLPSLKEVFEPVYFDEKDEVFDVDFNDEGHWVMATSSKKLCILSTTTSSSSSKDGEVGEEGEEAEIVQTISRPQLSPALNCTFRAAKFGRKTTSNQLYTIVNTTPILRTRKVGKNDKKSYVSKWNTLTWKLEKTKVVCTKPVTSFDISADGTLLAFGAADLSVGVLDSKTLATVLSILHAHDFPVTTLKFNPDASVLVSGSADNSVRVISIPPVGKRVENYSTLYSILITLFVLLLAILIQKSLSEDVLAAPRKAVGIL